MNGRFRIRVALIALALSPLVAVPRAADKRPITETDLFSFTWIADPQISPDGSRVAFVRVVVDKKRTGYESAICVAPSISDAKPA